MKKPGRNEIGSERGDLSLEFSLEEQINQQIKVKIIWLWNLACAFRWDPAL